jgi:predicted amidohydrolase
MFCHPFELGALRGLAPLEGQLHARFSEASKRHGVYINTGSFVSALPDGRLTNATFLYGPGGQLVSSYRKCHLFDVSFRGLEVKESSVFAAGDAIVTAQTGLGQVGMAICYDVRFPELFRKLALQGVELVVMPAVFNQITGPAHWHLMVRARAVENQVFLAAISQGRNGGSAYKAYGHSMVVSPWGDVLVEAGEGEEVLFADIDPSVLDETRGRLPLLRHRRADIY